MAQKIEMGKQYRTREKSYPTRILATDLKGNFPVVAAVEVDTNQEYPYYYREDGSYSGNIPTFDLIEVKPEIKGWVNIYRDNKGIDSQSYHVKLTREEADRAGRVLDRIACIPITFHEGDGLED